MDAQAEQATRDPEALEQMIGRIIEDAINFTDNTLSPAREEAAEYYRGEPFGNEEEGRSQIVLTEVRDGVAGILPSLLRVAFGAERIVEFAPKSAAQVEMARQATDVVQSIFAEQNNGFLICHSALKDGLIKRLGVIKIGAITGESVEEETLTGLTGEQLVLLSQDPEIEMGEPTGAEDGTFSVAVTRRRVLDPQYTVEAVPPEEFLYDRDARSVGEATFVGHRRELRRSELVAMGIPEDVIDEYGGTSTELRDNEEAEGRRTAVGDIEGNDQREAGPENEPTLYVEGYFRLADERGMPALRKICTIGPTFHIVMDEPAEDIPFYTFCPDPEPHTMTGQGWADRLMDMQKYKSSLLRASSDSLALSIFPRMGYVDTLVNTSDVLNTEIGAPIRMKQPNAIQVIEHPFVGKEALTLLAYADDIIERRTGRNRGTAGLDANALQSSTKEGVQQVLASSQEQQEMIARIFAEGTLKPLFRGLLRLVHRTQPRAMTVKIRGAWTEVDPRAWDADLGVSVSAALGTSFIDGRVNDLMMIAAKQEQMLTALGPANPIVSLPQYRYTLERLMRAKGMHDVDAHFLPIAPDWQPPPPEPAPPSPETVIAQATLEVEKMKTEKELEIKEAELALKQVESQRAHEFRMREIELKANLDLEQKRLDAEARLEIARMQQETQLEIARIRAQHELHKTLQDGVLREEEIDVKRTAAERPAPTGGAA